MAVRRFGRVGLALAAVALLAGCTTATPAAVHTSPPATSPPATASGSWLPAGAIVQHDVAYGSDPKQQLDVYSPAGAHGDPVILMVHGGGWRRGDKADAAVVDNKVAHYLPAGYVFVSANYRLYPQVNPTQEAADVASALAFVQAHAAPWGGDPHRVVLMGHSAGANLVSLVAADPSYLTTAGGSEPLALVSLDSAAYDVPQIMQAPHLGLYDPIFGQDQNLWKAASPTLNVSGTPPPALLVCGTGRSDSCPQAHAFAAALATHGDHAQVFPTPLAHEQIDSELGAPGALTQAVDAFLKAQGLPH